MKKRLASLSVLLLVPFLVSCGENNTNNSGNSTQGGGTTLEYRKLADSINTYYANVDTSSKEQLESTLHTIITTGYVKKTYKEAYSILAEADEDPFNKDNILCNYTGVSIPKALDSTSKGWNREHTYPKSHGFNDEKFEAYSDCHHLMATGVLINSKRGDLDFDEVANYAGTAETDAYGNAWINSTCFEPRDEVKGDIARMLFYMTIKYNDSTLDIDLVNAIPTKTTGTSGKGTLGNLATLIKWHYQDPVSDKEIARNEVVFSYQKNRNPFIDHPEWVNVLYDTDFSKETVTDSKVTAVIKDINELPETLTLENEEKVNSIMNAVKALNSQEKLYVNNYYKLTKANQNITYLKENSSQAAFDIYLDFSGTGLASSYSANQTFTVSEHSFTVSSGGVNNGVFVAGTNGKSGKPGNTDLAATFGLTGYGAYLQANFSIQNAKKFVVDVGKGGGTIDKVYLMSKTDSTYTKLAEVAFKEGKLEFELDNFSGQFVLVFGASSSTNYPRMIINSIAISTN